MSLRDQSYTTEFREATFHTIDERGRLVVDVVARRTRDCWALDYACPYCPPKRGKPQRHHHGGGKPTEAPSGGSRNTHCPVDGSPHTIFLNIVGIADEAVAK